MHHSLFSQSQHLFIYLWDTLIMPPTHMTIVSYQLGSVTIYKMLWSNINILSWKTDEHNFSLDSFIPPALQTIIIFHHHKSKKTSSRFLRTTYCDPQLTTTNLCKIWLQWQNKLSTWERSMAELLSSLHRWKAIKLDIVTFNHPHLTKLKELDFGSVKAE